MDTFLFPDKILCTNLCCSHIKVLSATLNKSDNKELVRMLNDKPSRGIENTQLILIPIDKMDQLGCNEYKDSDRG